MNPQPAQPTIHAQHLGDAAVTFDGSTLTAVTAGLRRTWRWTGRGLLTTAIAVGGRTWQAAQTADADADADWLVPACEGGNPQAEIVAVRSCIADDQGFTSAHACLEIELAYPAARLAVRFTVWAYPGSPGLRQQLAVRALDGYAWDPRLHFREISPQSQRCARLEWGSQPLDRLPLELDRARRSLIGYHSDTQNRNDPHLDLLLEVEEDRRLTHPSLCNWANAICIERDGLGVALVKESHRTVNQRGHDTGEFICLPGHGLLNTGWGIKPQEIDAVWRPAWATWCLGYAPGGRARQEAFKRFDALRYPVTGEARLRLQANTWGSSHGGLESRDAAAEANVLPEIDSCADLGIEVLQIDDGWQGDTYANWKPEMGRYPRGWGAVRARAAERGIDLGLWMSVARLADETGPTLAEMERCAEEVGFVSFKFDFADLKDRKAIDVVMERARSFIAARGQAIQIDWDLTEVVPRYGYFFAREYGRIYLANRKPVLPRCALYRPGTMLRDLWQVSRYLNLMKFQGSIQDPSQVDPLRSDAAAYGFDYCVAIALMSSPLFFCETRRFAPADRELIRPLLAAWRRARPELRQGMVHPIGERPDGTHWTGFENILPGDAGGHLLVFREPWCEAAVGRLALPHLAGRRLELRDVLTGVVDTATVAADGTLELASERAGSFRFLRYRFQA